MAFSRPPLAYPREPYARLLERSIERFPEKTAIVSGEERVTYRALGRRADACARALLERGVAKGDRVAIFMANSPAVVAAWFACARIGAVAVLVNPASREEEVAYQLADAGARVVLVGAALEGTARAAARGAAVLVAGPDLLSREGARPPRVEIEPEKDLLALPYSSGTTGLPKGVMLTHRNLAVNHLQFCSALAVGPESVVLIYLPLYHIYGCMLMGGAVAAGATQVILERFEPEACLAAIERHRVTHWFAVPPVLLLFANRPDLARAPLRSVRVVMTGAAPLPPDVGRRFAERTGLALVQGYGLTEAGPLTHVDRPGLCRLDSVGFAVSDQEEEIVDLETGERPLGPGEPGELRLRGPHVMKGYWRAPELTAATLRGGWLYTGDIGYRDGDGRVFITDRKKEMIKWKGFGVAPAELEAVLHEHPDVADAAVVGKPDAEAGEIPKAFVVARAGCAPSTEELMAFVAARLAGYKRVREVELVDAIPRTASGKILRRVLRERERNSQAISSEGANR